MGFIVKQIMLSGLEAAGGHNLAVVEVDAVADFASLPTFQDGSIGYIKGNPNALYRLDTTWQSVLKSGVGEGPQIEIDGVSPYVLVMMFRLLQERIAKLPENVLTARGDTVFRDANGPAKLVKGTAGQVLTQGANDPAWADVQSLAFTDTNSKYATDTLIGALTELGFLLSLDRKPYYRLAALPTLEADLYEGKLVYNTTDHTLQVCTTPGEQEIDEVTVSGPATAPGAKNVTITLHGTGKSVAVNGGTLEVRAATITAAASANGNLTVKLDGADTTVAVVAGDTAAQVAGKITTAFAADAAWTVGNVDAVLTFTAKAVGPKAGAFSIGVAATGVTCTAGITLTALGVIADTAIAVATKLRAASYTGWTTGGTAGTAIVTFTKDAVGAGAAPTAVDTDSTGVTFSAFSRTNQGVTSVWGACINAA